VIVAHKTPKATLLYCTPLAVAEIGGRVCYDSFESSENSIIKFFKQNPEHFIHTTKDEDVSSSDLLYKLAHVHFHHSVLEHIQLSYYIKDIPRNVILEANRHRIGVATSQKSSRYTIDDLVNAWVSGSRDAFAIVVKNNVSITDTQQLRVLTEYLWDSLQVLDAKEQLEADLKGGKKKHQNDRVKFILPECWVLEGVWTFNLRSLKHFLDLRLSGSAYYGIQEMAQTIVSATPKKYLELIQKPND